MMLSLSSSIVAWAVLFSLASSAFSQTVSGSTVPLPVLDDMTRLAAADNVANISKTYCTNPLSMVGSETMVPMARGWAALYREVCNISATVQGGGCSVGVAAGCNSNTVQIGLVDRPITATEAIVQQDKYDYRCLIGSKATTRQVPVAKDAIVLAHKPGGVAANCIQSLGGLTLDQVRWIYSSYTQVRLLAHGWNASAVPKSDGNDSTHLWSELGGPQCRSVEIQIAGPPSTSEKYGFFSRTVLVGPNETVASQRSSGYYSSNDQGLVAKYVASNSVAIGLLKLGDYLQHQGNLTAAPIKGCNGAYVSPSITTIGDNTYCPLSQLLYMNLGTLYWPFQTLSSFVRFGYAYGDSQVLTAGLVPLSQSEKSSYSDRLNLHIASCFSSRSFVDVRGKGMVQIQDLRIGDLVKGGSGKFSAVYSFGHYAPDVDARFIQLHFAQNSLELTPEHMVFVKGGLAKPASAVSVGDELVLDTGDASLVTAVRIISRRGMYGPLTTSGTIVVNGVTCSVYVDVQKNSGFVQVGSFKTLMTWHFMAHVLQSFHRLMCQSSWSICRAETHNQEGLSTRLAGEIAMYEWFLEQHPAVMAMVFVPVFTLGLAIYTLEQVVDNSMLAGVIAASFWYVFRSYSLKRQL